MTTVAAPRPSPARVAAAWSVHLLTALGGVAGTGALLALLERELHAAALLLLAALAIDCVDGSLARAARVSEVLPWFDGRRLDDIVDF
jgi:phosphatidylcholine synthase